MKVRKESDRITQGCGFSLLLSQPWLHASGFALDSTQAARFVNVIPTIIKLGNTWGRKIVISSPKRSNETEKTFQTQLWLELNTSSISIKSLNQHTVAIFHVQNIFLLHLAVTLDESDWVSRVAPCKLRLLMEPGESGEQSQKATGTTSWGCFHGNWADVGLL